MSRLITDDQNIRRQQLLGFYHEALKRVHGECAVSRYLFAHPMDGEWAVIAVGKAAAAMARGAQQQLGNRLHSGLVITRHGYGDPQLQGKQWRCFESGHPLPDAMSLQAGEAVLRFLEELPEGVSLLFLLSGGASTVMEALPAGVTLDDLVRVNDWLLVSGLPINQMNAVRQRLSRIKGGRLARHLRGRTCLQLMISDVPGDDPTVIGSAPLFPSAEIGLPENLPGWLIALLGHTELAPSVEDEVFAPIETHIVADNRLLLQTVKVAAKAQGLAVYLQPGHFRGDVAVLAKQFVEALKQGKPGLYLWGGESSVVLPRLHGKGGRSQHLALIAAELLAGHRNLLLFAAGTDGSDGPGEVAGALVDGGSKARAEEEGFSLALALANADSGTFLAASGDLIETGPTGSNVMDLVVGWKTD